MEHKAVITLAAAVSLAVASLAQAGNVPDLAASKAPGTVAAPSPSSLSYLQPAPGPAKPAAAAPAPAKPATAAPAPARAATAPEPAKPAMVLAKATPQPAPVKKAVRRVRKATPAPVAASEPALPGTFDLKYSGDIWKAMQLIAAKRPQLMISAVGSPFNHTVHLDLRGADLIEALRAIGDQTGEAIDLVYNNQTHELRVTYKARPTAAVPAPQAAPLMGTLASTPDYQAPKIKPGPATSPVDEARNWQKGGTARPIMGQDGVLLFPYGQSQPTLTCEPLRACDVQLQAGEIINNVILGDTVRWQVAPATTGNGSQATPHVIVKPTETNLQTNMVVTTNRRTYMLTLASSSGQYLSRVGFYYPHDLVQDWNGQAEAERRKLETEEKRKVSELPIASIDQLNLDSYRLKGDRSLPWYPVRVFDDGTRVFIQMPASVKSSEAPAMVLENNGVFELVNYRVKPAQQGGMTVTYYVVDKLFAKGALLVGVGGDQQKVEIIRNKQDTAAWGGFN
jgi:P-type conjugative transfer protein TrbG